VANLRKVVEGKRIISEYGTMKKNTKEGWLNQVNRKELDFGKNTNKESNRDETGKQRKKAQTKLRKAGTTRQEGNLGLLILLSERKVPKT